MKKMITSGLAIIAVLAGITAASNALFSDTETSAGNKFTAGTLNLQVGAEDPTVEKINLSNVVPTNSGNAALWLIKNTGSIAGKLSLTTSAVSNTEGTNPESETGNIAEPGELGGKVKIAIWVDADKSGAWSSKDYYLKSDQTSVVWSSGTVLPSAAYETVDSFASKSWINLATLASSAEAGNFRVEYEFPDGGASDNDAQGDTAAFDLTFSLTQ